LKEGDRRQPSSISFQEIPADLVVPSRFSGQRDLAGHCRPVGRRGGGRVLPRCGSPISWRCAIRSRSTPTSRAHPVHRRGRDIVRADRRGESKCNMGNCGRSSARENKTRRHELAVAAGGMGAGTMARLDELRTLAHLGPCGLKNALEPARRRRRMSAIDQVAVAPRLYERHPVWERRMLPEWVFTDSGARGVPGVVAGNAASARGDRRVLISSISTARPRGPGRCRYLAARPKGL